MLSVDLCGIKFRSNLFWCLLELMYLGLIFVVNWFVQKMKYEEFEEEWAKPCDFGSRFYLEGISITFWFVLL